MSSWGWLARRASAEWSRVPRAEKNVLRQIIGFPRKHTLTVSFDPHL
jgi:hypothetical protein